MALHSGSKRIKAFVKNEQGDYEEVDNREYWFNHKDYNIWFYEHDVRLYTDAENLPELELSTENLGDGWENRLDVEIQAGHWDRNHWGEMLGDDDYTVTITDGTLKVALTDAYLHSLEDYEDIRVTAEIYPKNVEKTEDSRINGETDAWFHIQRPWFDFHGIFDDATHLVGDRWFVSKIGKVYLETALFPNGADVNYTITNLTTKSSEDEFDDREVVNVIRPDEDEEPDEDTGWLFEAQRGGVLDVHVSMLVENTYEQERDFRIIVGGRKIDMGLETETGSDRLQPGGSIRVFPQIYAEEYDWNTGDRYGIDTSNYQVRYEVRCNRIDQRIIDEQFDGNFERATERGVFWDYFEDPESRSIVLITEENADNMELEIEAFLIDPDSGEECARADRRVFVNSLIYAVELFEEGGAEPYTWDKDLPPGAEVTLVPRLMKKEGDGEFEPVEGTDVTYRMGWYTGGDPEHDPAHIIVSDGGRELQPNDEISGPVTIKRNVAWNFNFNVEAEWEGEDGWMQGVGKSFVCNEVNYSDGFIVNNNRGDEWSTWYYDDEMISIKPDRDKLDALAAEYPVETTVEMGICIDRENNTIIPIQNYVIDDEGVAQYSNGEYDISQIFSENGGLTVNGENLINLQRILRYQNKPKGDRWPVLDLRIHSELNGVKLIDHVMSVDILSEIKRINEFRDQMGVGTEQIWENGRASLYVEDSDHDYGQDFDINITNIALKNAGDGEFLKITQNGADWSLKALKTENRVPVIFTFTGGPEGYDTFEAYIAIADGVFDLELRNSKGERVENLDVLLGGTEKLVPYVTYTEFGENGPTVIELPELATEGIPYCYATEEHYNENVIDMNGDLDITGLRRGNTDLEIVVTIYDGRDPEKDVYELRSHVNVNVYVSMAVLDLPENATVYAVPGLTYTADEIGQKVGGTLTVYSMKQPDGAEYPITDYRLEEVIGGDGKLTLTDGDERAYTTLNVAADAPLTESTLILAARESYGNRASAGLKVKVQNASIASNWAGNKATIAKTKHKDVKITFSDGDAIASITTSNKDIVTAKQGALAAGSAGKLVQNIRVTAGTKAGTGKITVKLKSGKSIVLTITVPKVNCTGITAKSSYTVTTLSTIDMGVKLNPVYSDNTITYKSANTKIATVTSKGVVKGIKVGKTTITITTSNKKTKKVTINVKQGTTGLTTAKTAYTVVVGKTVSIGAKKKPTNSADPIKYTSANKAIATVSSTGAIKGVKAGKTTITVKSGTKTKKVTVTVKPKTTGITTLKTAYTVKVKKTVSLGVKTVPATSGEPLTYTSSNAKIATVSKTGVVTGVKKGKVTITIKSGAVTKKVTVTVN